MTDLIADLKSNKLKVTPQRLAIYSYLCSTKEHPSAETIYSGLKGDYPNMSLATVYKTVASLKNAGLILELNVGEDSFRYDACTRPHAHVVCKKCHRVADYMGNPLSADALSAVEGETGYSIESAGVYFFVLCDACKD